MKNIFCLAASAPIVAILGLSGCEVVPGYETWDETQFQNPTASTGDPSTIPTTPVDTTPTPTPTPQPTDTSSGYGGAFVAGNKDADHGTEIYAFVNGMDIRCLANDTDKIHEAVGGYYFISGDLIKQSGALTWNGNTFTARSFTSSRSGKKYRWMGWTIEKSANPLVTSNPLTLGSFKGTLRSYWATVQ